MIVPGDKAMSIILVDEAITHRSSHARSGKAILGALGIVFINRKTEGATPVFVTSEGSELK